MGNSQDSLGLTYLNQPKPDNLINKYSKRGREGHTLALKSDFRLTFFDTKIKQLNHASQYHADFCLNSTGMILLNSN